MQRNALAAWAAAAVYAVSVSSVFAQAPAGDAKAGAQKVQMCQGCHGIPGWRTAYPEVYHVPKIAGQHPQYFVNALKAYKSGDRKHPSMRAIAQSLSDKDMADLAAYYATDAKPVAVADPAGVPEVGKTCVACHSANGVSTDPNNPHLAGQWRDYLEKALRDYKSGERNNAIMGGFAKTLSKKDIENLAAYYSAQRPVLDAKY
ncbi:MAG: c-type cytochrome [Casimicrobium sp.]